MIFIKAILFFLLGLLLGEFFVIWGLKVPIGKMPLLNHCPHCHIPYTILECIPLYSYIKNRGDCPACGEKIPFFYSFLKLLTALLFVLFYCLYARDLLSLYACCIFFLLTSLWIVICVSDFTYYVILDSALVISGLCVLILQFCFRGFKEAFFSLLSGFFLFLFMLIIKIVGDKIFGQESLGGGDIKLSTLFGFLFGIQKGIIVLIVGSFLAFPVALYSTIRNSKKEIPFGPFLVGSAILLFFLYSLSFIK